MSGKQEKREEEALPFVVCECGARINIVSNLDEMASDIEAHVVTHEKNDMTKEEAEAEHCRIEEMLSQQVISLIGKTGYNRSTS